MTLRRVLVLAATVLSVASVTACIALIVFTTQLRETTDEVIHVMDERALASDLTTHAMTYPFETTPPARALAEARGRDLLARVNELTRTPDDRQRFQTVAAGLEELWKSAPGRTEALSPELIAALHTTTEIHEERARIALDRAHHLDTIANLLGVVLAVLLGAGVAFTMWWIRFYVSRPLRALAVSVDRFAHGDLDARAIEHGASELRALARTHNEMADALARTRFDQLQYVATVVDDLRGPLAALQLAAGDVTAGVPLPGEDRVRELFAVIDRQLRRMSSIVGDVLAAIQADTGALVLRLEPCDAAALARESLDVFEAMAAAHPLSLEQEGATTVRADRRRLKQVVNNLLANAAKYSRPASAIAVKVRGEADHVTIAVTDQGPGITPEQQKELFQPFTRGRNRYEEVSGVGLGLYVSRRIVEAHGGAIEARSSPGIGTTFTVTLPRKPDEA